MGFVAVRGPNCRIEAGGEVRAQLVDFWLSPTPLLRPLIITYEHLDLPESKRRLVLPVCGPPEESIVDAAVMALADLYAGVAE